MNVFVGQIYIQAGINYPFSHHFQAKISNELTALVEPSALFIKKYSADYNLMFNMSAKEEIDTVETKGPTVFKKGKDVEYSIFLTHDGTDNHDYKHCLSELFDGIKQVLGQLEIDTSAIEEKEQSIIESIIADETMFRL